MFFAIAQNIQLKLFSILPDDLSDVLLSELETVVVITNLNRIVLEDLFNYISVQFHMLHTEL